MSNPSLPLAPQASIGFDPRAAVPVSWSAKVTTITTTRHSERGGKVLLDFTP